MRLLSDAVDLLSGETDMVVHAGQTDSETYFGSSGKWGGGDVVGTFRIPNLLPVRLSI